MKYVTKLKYDEKPDYEKCRKIFVDGLKSIGKTNSGDLEFKTSSSSSGSSASAKRASAAISPVKESRLKVGRPSGKSNTKATDNVENISPKGKNARKRDVIDSSEESPSPSKKVRTNTNVADKGKVSTQNRTIKTSGRTTTTDSSIVINNHVNKEKGKKNKTYNINLDLDISFDANVVVSVKRKKKPNTEKVSSPNESFQSTDEIPPSDKSFMVKTTKVYKRAPRASPRSK